MADQQDQSSSGGSVEKASASADTSKPKGKSSGSGGHSRKRHNNNPVQATLEEKRRRQQADHPQPPQQAPTTHKQQQRAPVEFSKGQARGRNERRDNGAGLECFFGENWNNQRKTGHLIFYLFYFHWKTWRRIVFYKNSFYIQIKKDCLKI